jgi:two-component system NarL family sensor kinase
MCDSAVERLAVGGPGGPCRYGMKPAPGRTRGQGPRTAANPTFPWLTPGRFPTHPGSCPGTAGVAPAHHEQVNDNRNGSRDAPSGRTTVFGVFGVFAVALAELVVAVVGSVVAGRGVGGAIADFVVTNSAMGLAFSICGVLIAWQRPRNLIGWLLLADGLGHATAAAASSLYQAGRVAGWPEPVLRTVLTVFAYSWPWSIGLFLPLVLLLFPDGRLVSPWWRWWVWLTIGTSPLFVLDSAAKPGVVPGGLDPWLVLGNYVDLAPLWTVAEAWILVILLAALAGLVIRYRHGDEQRRRQLLWLALAVGLVVAVLVPWGLLGTGPILILLAIPLIPVAITVAIMRHQLLDIRLIVSRAVLYALLTAGVIAVYLGLVAVFDLALRSEGWLGTSVAATIIVAVAFNPVRVGMQRVVDRVLYGDRADPLRAASRVGAQLATAGPGLEAVPAALCEALRLPFAALRGDGEEVAVHGVAPETLHTVDLDYCGARVGELVVGARAGERRLDPADRAVLELLAVPLAVALRATALSATVQRSREQIVAAREEERRRLRRDLHDGLGPALTGIAFQADAVRNLLTADPTRATELLDTMRTQTTTAIADIRRLVYGLRPPALDELGLLATLRREAERLAPLTVQIDATEPLPALPAAVEVAAYRIATEAMTNIARHAHATRARLVLCCATDLHVEITDNGHGTSNGINRSNGDGPTWQAGVGLTSMTERAAELGGSCTAGPATVGGWVVRATLPLAATSPVDAS